MPDERRADADPAAADLVGRFWDTLYRRDWDALGGFFGATSTYTDMCTPTDDVAVGASQIVRRLRLGLEPISGYEHRLIGVTASGGTVVTEHTETWRWRDGEQVELPFVSVQETDGHVITRWSDYWDLQTLLGAAPAWWIEHIMGGWQ
ncbi:MAG: limonene-1,2-epoxide hydrolase family protein [Microthrixaceae bacterium]|jgi:limonene-1,2-epoxide hydrolase|nr:nuclear transport factor 2 family protein [Actinomycetota bacterium]MBP6728444.1 nuclear transport factor 2 family protein [Microthrixaceae bacterium]HMT62154.1 limonene-1,2-epoxide hydrolase family protein [Microthrixaceae bacterium]